MINRYPLWKSLLVVIVLLVGAVYALPNLYGDDPALQVSPAHRNAVVDASTEARIANALSKAGVAADSSELGRDTLLMRFADTDLQLKAYEAVRDLLGRDYTVALNLAPAAPQWLLDMGALPMYLGLDLRGGVHFLMQVDMEEAEQGAYKRYQSDIRTLLRENDVRMASPVTVDPQRLVLRFNDQAERQKAYDVVHGQYRDLVLELPEEAVNGKFEIYATLSDEELRETKKFALQQNITTLRNRVNELGVAEPVIQQQGDERIVVQLPGVQDTARAKEVLGATATLEYHMVDDKHDLGAALAGRVPPGSRLYRDREGRPHLLYKRVIITGDQIIDAASGIDSQSGGPMVTVTLDGNGARRMDRNTKENVGRGMAVVFIEKKSETRTVDGVPTKVSYNVEEVISVATIRERFSKRFQTTGLDSPEEARNIALLLRAGALAAPMEIVEERTIGPSLGKDNIDQGFRSVLIGFVLVLAFMAVWYRGFGTVANLALAMNLVLIVAVLSMLQATLTLPGIAGIVLTVGMAVDANVLIFERIREELRNGMTPQAAIHSGYERAVGTIADANITTLIASVVLFTFGTGPIKGFAITLSIGIVTSMFTAIVGTRAVINAWVGGRRVSKLSI